MVRALSPLMCGDGGGGGSDLLMRPRLLSNQPVLDISNNTSALEELSSFMVVFQMVLCWYSNGLPMFFLG